MKQRLPFSWSHPAILVLSTLFFACSSSGSGCGGCGDDSGEPYVFEGTVQDHVVFQGAQIHVTQAGLDRISDNLDVLLGSFMDGDGLSFCLEKTGTKVIGVDIAICNSGTCDDGTVGCQLDIGLDDVRIIPTRTPSPTEDEIKLSLVLNIDETLPTSILGCAIELKTPRGFPVSATALLTVGGAPWERVSIELPEDGFDYNLDDIEIGLSGGLLGTCGWLNPVLGFARGMLNDQLDDMLFGMINDQLGPALCQSCSGDAECGDGATCNGDGMCIYEGTNDCVPLKLGVEMAVDLGDLLKSVSPGLEAELGILAYLANYADAMGPPGSGLAYEGIDLAMELGFFSRPNTCVPWFDPPTTARVPKSPTINADRTPAGEDFSVGIGLHRSALNLAGWALYRSGMLCLSLGTETADQISTGTFAVLMPSLSALVAGENRPMILQLRPQRPLTFDLGEGTVTSDGRIIDPLITAKMDKLEIDFWAFTEDRFIRVFTLRTDLVIPLALDVNEASQLEILLGDLTEAFQNMEALNADLLSAADADSIGPILSGLIGGLLPTLMGDAIAPIDLPEIAEGISLVVRDITSVDGRQMLAIYADLAFGAPATKSLSLRPRVVTETVERPSLSQVTAMLDAHRVGGNLDLTLLAPRIRYELVAEDGGQIAGDAEFSYRMNGGLWSVWSSSNVVEVPRHQVQLSGSYNFEFRTRRAGEPAPTVPLMAARTVVVDYIAPTIEVKAEDGGWNVSVQDQHSPEGVQVRYRLDGGSWIAAHTDFRIDATAFAPGESRLDLEVEAVDALGNRSVETKTLLGESRGAAAPYSPATTGAPPASGGCTTAPGSSSGLGFGLVLLGLVFLRRRGAALVAVATLALALGACGKDNGTGTVIGACEPACDIGELCIAGVCEVVTCENDEDCAGDAYCLEGICYGACSDDDDCPAGATCEDNVCAFPATCETEADCADGEFCDDGICAPWECQENSDCGECEGFGIPTCTDYQCSCVPACADGCGDGYACCEQRDECVELVAQCNTKACDTGYHVQPIADPVFNAETCAVTVECDCVEMPPLPLGNTGVYLDVDVAGDISAIAAYNSTYGDLMVGTIDGTEIAWQFVDGLSDDTRVTGSLNGPRGGIATAGPDVGQYPSIAVAADGGLHVAYYAVTGDFRRSLMYAYAAPTTGERSWEIQQVDATDGAGRYTDLVIGADGFPMIAYVVPSIKIDSGDYQSQIRVLRATSTTPTSAGDWEDPVAVVAVDSEAACGNGCVGRQVCRMDLQICETPLRAGDCSDDCGRGACFSNEGGDNVCADTEAGKLSGPATVYDGIGVFLDMELLPGDLLGFAYYDSTHGNLVYAETDVASLAPAVGSIVDGQVWDDVAGEWVDTGDVGWYPDLFVDSDGQRWIAYGDATAGSVRVADLTAGTTTPVDDGFRCYNTDANDNCIEPLKLRVGYDAQIAEDGSGLWMVYQDATWHEVLESPHSAFGWQVGFEIGTEGSTTEARGFYLGHDVDGSGRFVVSYRLNQRLTPPVRDTVVIRR